MCDAHYALTRLGWSDEFVAAFLNASAVDQAVSMSDSDVPLEAFDATEPETPVDSPIRHGPR